MEAQFPKEVQYLFLMIDLLTLQKVLQFNLSFCLSGRSRKYSDCICNNCKVKRYRKFFGMSAFLLDQTVILYF